MVSDPGERQYEMGGATPEYNPSQMQTPKANVQGRRESRKINIATTHFIPSKLPQLYCPILHIRKRNLKTKEVTYTNYQVLLFLILSAVFQTRQEPVFSLD